MRLQELFRIIFDLGGANFAVYNLIFISIINRKHFNSDSNNKYVKYLIGSRYEIRTIIVKIS